MFFLLFPVFEVFLVFLEILCLEDAAAGRFILQVILVWLALDAAGR